MPADNILKSMSWCLYAKTHTHAILVVCALQTPMSGGIIKLLVVSFVAVKAYRYWYERMLSDSEYLERLCREKRESDHEQLVHKTLEEARFHEERREFDMALEYYMYALKALKCERKFVMESLLTEEVRDMLKKLL
eukprot:jgi/Antlo1/2530/1041